LKISGIYKITNLTNDKFYIGQSIDVVKRIRDHKSPRSLLRDFPIYRAFKKYGLKNFKFEILEECPIEKLNDKEIYYIQVLKPHYNVNEGGVGNRGHKVSPQLKKRFSLLGKERWQNMTDEQRANFCKNNLAGPRVGHSVSESTRLKLRLANVGKKQSADTKQKKSISAKEACKNFDMAGRKCPIIQIDKTTNQIIKEYPTIKCAADHFGVHPTCILGVLKGRRKSSCGYFWRYK